MLKPLGYNTSVSSDTKHTLPRFQTQDIDGREPQTCNRISAVLGCHLPLLHHGMCWNRMLQGGKKIFENHESCNHHGKTVNLTKRHSGVGVVRSRPTWCSSNSCAPFDSMVILVLSFSSCNRFMRHSKAFGNFIDLCIIFLLSIHFITYSFIQ